MGTFHNFKLVHDQTQYSCVPRGCQEVHDLSMKCDDADLFWFLVFSKYIYSDFERGTATHLLLQLLQVQVLCSTQIPFALPFCPLLNREFY